MRLVSSEAAGSACRWLTFDAPVAGHARVGQWCKVGLGGGESAFALVNGPGAPMRLLVKAQGGVAEALCAATPGAEVGAGEARGGFPMERVDGRPLLVLVNGTGLSAVHAAIEAELASGLRRPVALFYGVRRVEELAWGASEARWRAAGVALFPVVSRPDGSGWTGAVGHVQDVAAASGWVRDAVGALLVGHGPMVSAAKAALIAAGVPADRVLVNF